MTPDEADQRIMLSRRTLATSIHNIQQTGVYPIADLGLVRDEIFILEGIAEEHPSKAMMLYEMLTWWRAFDANVRSKLN